MTKKILGRLLTKERPQNSYVKKFKDLKFDVNFGKVEIKKTSMTNSINDSVILQLQNCMIFIHYK